MKYVRKFNKNIDIKPIAICNFLMNRGYNGKRKKRTLFDKNPVAVIMNIGIKQLELEKFVNKNDAKLVINNPDFEKMIQILESQYINNDCLWYVIK